MVMPGARVSGANHCVGWRAVNASRPPRRWPRVRRRASRRVGRARALLEDLVGAPQHRRRDRKAEDFGGLEIDHELELGWLLDGEIGWLSALEGFVGQVTHSARATHY